MLGVIVFDFDPLLHFDGSEIRLETVALAIVMVSALVMAGLIARVTPAARGQASDPRVERGSLRPDDLLFIAMGALPGAVIGGRIGYVLLHLDYYAAHQGEIVDHVTAGGDAMAVAIERCGLRTIITSRTFLQKANLPARPEMVFLEDIRKTIGALDKALSGAYPAQEAELKKNNVRYEGHIYPNSVHGFFNDATPERYNKAAAEQAWARTIEWFNQYVRA